jgi:chaperone modulatory protein CbpM
MIRETELIAQFTYLERQVLLTWIEEGVIAPRRDEEGYLFDRVDESRVALACDLFHRSCHIGGIHLDFLTPI